MRKILCLLAFITILVMGAPASAQSEPIHVKVGPTSSSITLSTDGNLMKNGSPIGSRFNATPSNVTEADVFSSTAGYIVIGKKPYRGSVRFVKSGSQLKSVNIVDVDDYIRGVLPKEIGTTTPMEALKVQAVVSRSFAYANWNKFAKYGYNLDDSSASQAYAGMSVESPMTDRAVAETKGQVLYYKGDVANTIFHATSGGETEAIEEVWGGYTSPYLKALKDPYSLNTRHATWEATLSSGDIRRAFPSVGEPTLLEVLERSSTGRIKSMAVVGTSGREIVTGNQFRMKLGSIKVKSANFGTEGSARPSERPLTVITSTGIRPYANDRIISAAGIRMGSTDAVIRATGMDSASAQKATYNDRMPIQGSITLKGTGYGHGVGLSQYGAIEMAKAGKNYKAILSFYYPGTELR